MSTFPTKRIVSRHHLQTFLTSQTHIDLVKFLNELNESVSGIKLTDEVVESQSIKSIMEALESVEKIIEETPPVENGKSRFGNPAFRTFYDTLVGRAPSLHASIPGIPIELQEEISGYFIESWGNRTRVDYGSGMELNFICWLLCLKKVGVLTESDDQAVVMRIFWKYMKITRMLQTTYWLEPAGSHGAQGLDDYHFAVFIFGSAQLRGHKHLRPKAIHDNDILEEFAKDYMYLSYIRFINSIKTASLRWHSPMLDDISGVKTWDKVNSGMMKMYQAEVLAKLPVAQHFLFGTLLPYPLVEAVDDKTSEVGVTTDEHGHIHVRGEGFGDCCGIPIPSAFAAAEQAKKRETDEGIRRIPFD